MVVVKRTGVVKLFPVPKEPPPVGAAYQDIVPADAAAAKVTVPDPTLDPGVVLVIVGELKIVKVFVEVAKLHATLNAVNVKVTDPAEISAALGL